MTASPPSESYVAGKVVSTETLPIEYGSDERCSKKTEQFMNQNEPIHPTKLELTGGAGRFSVQVWRPEAKSAEPIFVLPNGYGLLPYAQSVCEEFAARGHTVYSLNVRGQGDSAGECSVPGAAEDISIAMSAISEQEKSVRLLVHCTAALPLILLGKNSPFWQSVKSVLLYCYLADPQSHLDRFRLKCARYGVRFVVDGGRLDCFGPDAYRAIPVPLAIVHPLMPDNLRRASLPQVRELAKLTGATHLETPASGYNISVDPQKQVIRETIEQCFAPLLSEPGS